MERLIGTFNMQHGRDYLHSCKNNEIINLEAVADVIRDLKLDICGLNEVYNKVTAKDNKDQTKEIADRLGYYYHFAKAINYKGGEYGNAIVSKYPILYANDYLISVPREKRIEGRQYEDRVLIEAHIEVEGEKINFLVCHMGLYEDEIQLAIDTVKKVKDGLSGATVLMGDFNFTPKDRYYKDICSIFDDSAEKMSGNELTFPSDTPDRKIDYMFTNKDCKIKYSQVPCKVVSDHRPLMSSVMF